MAKPKRDVQNLAALRVNNDPVPVQSDPDVPDDVRDHPYISAVWHGTQETATAAPGEGRSQPDQTAAKTGAK